MKFGNAIILFLLLLSACSKKENADLLLSNGKIWTGDESLPWAEWVAAPAQWLNAKVDLTIVGGKIVYDRNL